VFFKRKRMLKKEAAGWEGPAAEKIPSYVVDAVRDLYSNDADTAYVGFHAEKAPK
jgi:hypothetical protein